MLPVMANYFRQTKYKSLLRQLQGYDFKRVTSGDRKGNVSHPSFVRGRRSLCMNMKRKQTKASTTSSTKDSSASGTKDTENNINKALTSSTKLQSYSLGSNASVEADQASVSRAIVVPPLPSKASNCNDDLSKREPQVPMIQPSCGMPVTPITQIDGENLKQLETNFQRSVKNASRQALNQHHMTTLMMKDHLIVGGHAAGLHQRRQQRQASGMDALRVEIGCSISSSDNKKRDASQRHQQNVIHCSVSAPTFENPRLPKRPRSQLGIQRYPSDNSSNYSSTYKNASFPLSMMQQLHQQQVQEDAVLKEEKLLFQKSQQDLQSENEFKLLESICHKLPQEEGTQQFRQMHNSSSSFGTVDLEVSLTTKTIQKNIDGPQVRSNTVCNSFFLPCQIEPTPMRSPSPRVEAMKSGMSGNNANNAFDLSGCNSRPSIISSFPSKLNSAVTHDIVWQVPSVAKPLMNNLSDCHSTGELSLALESDDIDEDIVSTLCESDEDGLCDRSWANGITFSGDTDCVLEPDKFQMEAQEIFSKTGSNLQHQRLQQAPIGLQQQSRHHHQLRGLVMVNKQVNDLNLCRKSVQQVPQRTLSAQHPLPAMPVPYHLLSRPMPLQRHYA